MDLVARIASIPLRKVVMCGNHEAWYSLTARGRARLQRKLAQASGAGAAAALEAAADGGPSPSIARMLELLGTEHIGYRSLHCEELGFSIIGEREGRALLGRWAHGPMCVRQGPGALLLDTTSPMSPNCPVTCGRPGALWVQAAGRSARAGSSGATSPTFTRPTLAWAARARARSASWRQPAPRQRAWSAWWWRTTAPRGWAESDTAFAEWIGWRGREIMATQTCRWLYFYMTLCLLGRECKGKSSKAAAPCGPWRFVRVSAPCSTAPLRVSTSFLPPCAWNSCAHSDSPLASRPAA